MSEKITVLGAGAWGTALAANFSNNGHDVTLWGRDSDHVHQLIATHENTRYLPGIPLNEALKFATDVPAAIAGARTVFMAIPAQHMRSMLESAMTSLEANASLISCAKGIEQGTGLTMSEVFKQICPDNPAASLSGPSFAHDVALGLPTAVTIAAETQELALSLCQKLSNPQLRCYASDDLVGVEYGGALKNVLAIVAGMVYGRNLGASALAAITARGFGELQAVALTIGAKPETLVGLSGLGDLILTCASEQSRNFAYGAAFSRGDDLSKMKLAEGVTTAKVAAKIAADNKVDAPLIRTVSEILDGELSIDEAIEQLMSRPVKTEV